MSTWPSICALQRRESRAVWNNPLRKWESFGSLRLAALERDLEARRDKRELGHPGYCEIRNETLP